MTGLRVSGQSGCCKCREHESSKILTESFSSQVCGGDLPCVSPESLEERHHFNFKEALYSFSSTKKMGGQEFSDRYQAQLEKELEEMWESFSKHNEVRGQTE